MQENFPVAAPSTAVFFFESHEVSVVIKDGEPWFVAKDVATVLGYTDTGKARKHCKKAELYQHANLAGRLCDMYIIPESDVFRLAIKSTLPAAEKFEDWVMEEVLPSIRKTGSYVVANPATQHLPAVSTDPLQLFLITADAVKHLADKTVQLENRTSQIEDVVLDTAGKFEDFLDSQPMRPHQCHTIQKAVAEKVNQLSEKHNLAYRPVIFSAIYGFLKRHFQVNTYSAIASLRFEEALAVVKNLVLEQLPEKVASLPKHKEVTA